MLRYLYTGDLEVSPPVISKYLEANKVLKIKGLDYVIDKQV